MRTPTKELSKTTYLRGVKCIKSLYLNRFKPDLKDELDDASKALFKNGELVNGYARALYADGIDTDYHKDFDIRKATERTQELIKNKHRAIFEAAFMYENCLTILDILIYENGKWHGYEVKSSTSIKDEHIVDASYQYYIIVNSGFDIDDISIMYINNGYIRKGDIELDKLFKSESVLEFCKENAEEVADKTTNFKEVLESKDIPNVSIGEQCTDPHKCDFYTYCWKEIPQYSVFEISGLRMQKRAELYNSGIIKMVDLPADYKLNEKQKLQVQSHRDGKDTVNKNAIKKFLSNLSYPLFFLDFETIHPPVPMFNDSKPYQQIPFQFSLHKLESLDKEPTHYEFLAESKGDPRDALTKALVEEIGVKGSVFVYYISFERTRLIELAEIYQTYRKELLDIVERLVDLIIPFKEKYYYKAIMNGSSSIKDILPALVPDFSYDSLNIRNGDMASAAFEELIDSKVDERKIESIRNNLLEYCKLDTLAMVKILKVLNSLK